MCTALGESVVIRSSDRGSIPLASTKFGNPLLYYLMIWQWIFLFMEILGGMVEKVVAILQPSVLCQKT